jgi:hypothetical protein
MKNILLLLSGIALIFVITTCAVTFSGRQHISYVAQKHILSDNLHSKFESITSSGSIKESSNWFDNDSLLNNDDIEK